MWIMCAIGEGLRVAFSYVLGSVGCMKRNANMRCASWAKGWSSLVEADVVCLW